MQWDAERGRIAEEEKLIAAENRKKDEAKKVLDDAASAIQKIFRGMQARKATKKGKKVRPDRSFWMSVCSHLCCLCAPIFRDRDALPCISPANWMIDPMTEEGQEEEGKEEEKEEVISLAAA